MIDIVRHVIPVTPIHHWLLLHWPSVVGPAVGAVGILIAIVAHRRAARAVAECAALINGSIGSRGTVALLNARRAGGGWHHVGYALCLPGARGDVFRGGTARRRPRRRAAVLPHQGMVSAKNAAVPAARAIRRRERPSARIAPMTSTTTM